MPTLAFIPLKVTNDVKDNGENNYGEDNENGDQQAFSTGRQQNQLNNIKRKRERMYCTSNRREMQCIEREEV